jgi:hypothetical protein
LVGQATTVGGGTLYSDPTGHTAGEESIFDASLISSPLGNDPSGSGRYDNSLVYLLCFFTLLFAPVFGVAVLGVALYRVARHRPHAIRGLVVATLASCLGTASLVWALSR